ncbi:unnamed protein product [Darwinula stevensoni]|uniref:Enoyl reductase (ER) domain-containing protein n=1 Tax=Darwinula stevensoni TaxID=69355 RepID=A0A7R9FPX5_9CRUS|nr:unnamed protein product [Darwinula stevensoni]CAG0898440.1 unnamed protein product [Darwinula stevensoni]
MSQEASPSPVLIRGEMVKAPEASRSIMKASPGARVVPGENHHRVLCKQVSIESPSKATKETVFTFEVPMPPVPESGARIKVVCAGVCYRRRDSTLRRDSSCDSATARNRGIRDASLFPGYEVAGIVDALGENVQEDGEVEIGDRVIVYPYDGIPHGYAEYISIPETQYLLKLPVGIPLPVASMLPTGALWAMNAVFDAKKHVDSLHAEIEHERDKVKVLVVGTGGLALWALRLAIFYFGHEHEKVQVTVATLKDEGLADVAADYANQFNVVHWDEELHEKALIERTLDACKGPVDIVINFGTTTRSLLRSLQCLTRGGIVFIGSDASDFLIKKFQRQCEDSRQKIEAVEMGTYEQLQQLVNLVANKEIEPPPYTLFPAEKAQEVIRKMLRSEVNGRAILQFTDLV